MKTAKVMICSLQQGRMRKCDLMVLPTGFNLYTFLFYLYISPRDAKRLEKLHPAVVRG